MAILVESKKKLSDKMQFEQELLKENVALDVKRIFRKQKRLKRIDENEKISMLQHNNIKNR